MHEEVWSWKIFLSKCVCEFGFYVAFNNFSVISRRCLVATGSSMLTFIVLPHWSIISQTLDMIPRPVYPVNLSAKRGAASTIFSDFGMSRPGIEPVTSRSPERTLCQLSYWGQFFFFFFFLSKWQGSWSLVIFLLCISELLWLCRVVSLKSLPVHSFNALIIPILRGCFQSFFNIPFPWYLFDRAGCGIWLYRFLIIAYLFILRLAIFSKLRATNKCKCILCVISSSESF